MCTCSEKITIRIHQLYLFVTTPVCFGQIMTIVREPTNGLTREITEFYINIISQDI